MASMNSSHSKYAPRAAKVAPPPITTKSKILVAQKSSQATKYRPATIIVMELINKLIFLMLPHPRYRLAIMADRRANRKVAR